jgi:uncharacterized RDD family membrane protein YckC
MEFRSLYTMKTAENVSLNVELAGLVNRVFAFVIDAILTGILMAVSSLFFALVTPGRLAPELFKTVAPLIAFVLFFGYHLFQEWLWNGKTVGKVIFGIRVVRNNGQPIGFWESFGRNLLRVVDVYFSGIGLLCMMFNASEKRFGDFIAGTLVINDQPVSKPFTPGGADWLNDKLPLPEAAEPISLTAEEREWLYAFLRRRRDLFKGPRNRMVKAACQYLSERLHRPFTSEEDLRQLAIATQQDALASKTT